jgi:adenylate cyclase
MRKSHWITLFIALLIAGLFSLLEQRRGHYFIDRTVHASAFHTQEEQTREQAAIAREEASLDKKAAFLMYRWEQATYDLRFKLRGDIRPNPDIVIIAIDEASLKALHQWPWPRGIHAKLIRTLEATPPKALLFDVFFIEPFTLDPAGDRALTRATKENPWVVHSLFYEPNEGPILRLGLPFPSLLESAENLGYANALIDEDGVLRRAIPQRHVQDQTLSILSLAGAALYLNKPVDDVLKSVPLDHEGRLWVHYTGKEFTYTYVSYADVLSGKIPARLFAGKIVLVGSTAAGTFDHYPTPLSKLMPGVEFHANVIDTLVHLNAMRPVQLRVTVIAIGLFGLFCGLLIPRFSAGVGALWALGAGLIFAASAQWLFVTKNIVIDVAGPLGTLLGGYMCIVVYRFFTEEKEKRMVKGFFAQQVSSDLLDVLMENPQVLRKGGERREMTAFFSDVAGFTSISERLDPEELVTLLNQYLTAMTDVIFEYGGYLDKYMGDGIMAFWNGLLKQPDHAEKACRCALKSMQRLKELNINLEQRGLVPLKARIGVNTGTMVAGFMGSNQKNQYTIMGDNVNLASRLEGANKAFGSAIMISEFTVDMVADLFEMRFLDIIRVPGKAKPVKTYELLGEKGAVDGVWPQVLPLYHKAIQEFSDQQFQSAKTKFLEVLGFLGHDKPCETYIQRAEAFMVNPPPKDWDGVFELKTK